MLTLLNMICQQAHTDDVRKVLICHGSLHNTSGK